MTIKANHYSCIFKSFYKAVAIPVVDFVALLKETYLIKVAVY